MTDFYLKYIADYDVDSWSALNWYQEINSILQNKTVLHLHCFETNQDIRSKLTGTHISTDLVVLSGLDHANDSDKMNQSCNHLTDAGNFKLAEMLHKSILQHAWGTHGQ
jgi:hypothetical protein